MLLAVVLALTLSVQVFAVSGGTGEELYQNRTQLAQGLTYTNTIYSNSTYGREESFALELAPDSQVYPLVMACDTIYGGFTITNCIAYAESLGYNVVAAINTDFFNSSKVPLGMVVENGIYKSSASGQDAVAFLPDGKTQVVRNPEVTITLTNHGSEDNAANQGQSVSLTNLNKMRMSTGGMYLYSSAFSTVSTRTTGDGWNVRFRILGGELTTAGTMELEVVECVDSSTPVAIGDEYLVLTAAASGGWRANYEKFAVGDRVTLQTVCSDPVLAAAEQVTGCGDILVSNGQVTDPDGWDSALVNVNPRTVLGIKEDGTLLMYVVDGRKSNYSNGVSLQMLANEMAAEGCTDVVNLDGGGSSAMSVRLPGYEDCKTVNQPSDGAERACGSYLLLVTDKEKDGRAESLHILEDGNLLLAGSSMNLNPVASDDGLAPAELPKDVSIRADLGTVTDGVYYAPETGGMDTLTLRSPTTGAEGTGSVHVVDQVSGLSVKTQSGENVTSLRLEPEQTVQLAPSVYQYGRPVLSTLDAYTYTVTGDIGTVNETGLFTASGTYGATGSIEIVGGNQSVTIPVTVQGVFADVVGTWAEPYVTRLQNLGIVSGTTATTYSPDATLRRGDFMLMLYNAVGRPEVTGEGTFSDITGGEYYATAVTWAAQNGIAAGYDDGGFHPEGTLTREDAFAFIYRALKVLNVSYTDGDLSVLDSFTDSGELAEYARTPAATLISLNVVSGADGKLTPKTDLTRAQMARMVCSALDLASTVSNG